MCVNHLNQRGFSIWNYHKFQSALSDSFEYLSHESTAFRNMVIVLLRGSSLYVKIWRLQTSDSDVYRLQILTSTDFRFWRLQTSDSDVYRLQILTSTDFRFWRLQTSESDVYRLQILTSTDFRFWRLQTSDSDVYRLQILTSTDFRFWRIKTIPAVKGFKYISGVNLLLKYIQIRRIYNLFNKCTVFVHWTS